MEADRLGLVAGYAGTADGSHAAGAVAHGGKMGTAVEKVLHCEATACHSSSVDLVGGIRSVMEAVSAVAHLEGSETAAGIPSRCDARAADPRRG